MARADWNDLEPHEQDMLEMRGVDEDVWNRSSGRVEGIRTILEDYGPTVYHISDSHERSINGAYMASVGHYLSTGDPSRLFSFHGETINGHPVEINPSILDDLANSVDLSFDDLYEDIA